MILYFCIVSEAQLLTESPERPRGKGRVEMEKLFAVCDLDTFYVSVERLLDPTLIGKPVIVGGDPKGRGVVASCSYEARAYGVRSGMSSRDAFLLCPNAIFIRGHGEYYSYYSRLVKEILANFTPSVTALSIDEFLCDFSGMVGIECLYRTPEEVAKKVREKIYLQTGLRISVGMGANPLIAKVSASVAKPDGFIVVPEGQEAEFLAPLPMEKLPGVGEVIGEKLTEMGLRTIGDIAKMPLHILKSHFGKIGESLHAKALGGACGSFSESLVISSTENEAILSHPFCKSIGHEETFQDTADPTEILSILAGLCAEAGFRLREKALTTSLITLKLRYSDFKTVSMQEPVHCIFADEDIFAKAKELFNRLYTRRMPVRLVGVRLSRLTKNLHEIPLFEWEKRLKKRAFYQAVDEVRGKLGLKSALPLSAMRIKCSFSQPKN